MEDKILTDSVKRIANHYITLSIAKNDCDLAVKSEIEMLVANSNDVITPATKKNIKKVAKSIADEAINALSEETHDLDMLIRNFVG